MGFALFFIAEYSNIILMNIFFIILFLGGWTFPLLNFLSGILIFAIKINLCIFTFVWIRSSFPDIDTINQCIQVGRYFYLSIFGFILVSGILFSFSYLI